MTPRADLRCGEVGGEDGIEDDAALADFDQIPLRDAAGNIEAVYVRGRGVYPLGEAMLMAAHAPLLDFLETADRQGFRFLIDGGGVAGLVTLSDLQRLPVYSVLFSLVVAVEMLLMDWIRRRCVDDHDWLQHLTSGDRGQIDRHWKRRRTENTHVDRLAVASFTHELTAAVGLGLFQDDAPHYENLKDLIKLRNQVSHGIDIASTIGHALALPEQARNALELVEWLHQKINDLSA